MAGADNNDTATTTTTATKRFHLPPLAAGGIAVAIALIVAAAWCGRASRAPVVETALEATVSVRITRHDAMGMPSKPVSVRAPARVRAIVEALGIDHHPVTSCPPDYASAELGLLLSGRDIYGRRNVYVWNLFSSDDARRGDAGPNVIVVTSSGCRGGEPADVTALKREMLAADAGP